METLNQFMAGLGRNSLQAGVLVLGVLLAQGLSGKRLAPRWRCALWLLVVVRLLVPFSFSSTTSVFNLLPHWTQPATVGPLLVENSFPLPEIINPAPASPPVQVAEQQMNQSPASMPTPEPPAVTPVATMTAVPAIKPVPSIRPVAQLSWSWPVCLFWVWFAGAAVLLGHVLISSVRLARRCARMRPLTEPATLAVLEDCRKRLAMRTPLVMVESVEISSPALHGLFRPRLLLPKGFTAKFSPDELRFVFLHELAHLKRRDLWMNWVMALLQAVHWFNPLVWLGFARWRDDRELACDAMVLEAAGAEQNKEYGQIILRLLENFTHPLRTPGLVGILEDKRQLRRRIGMIATYAPAPRWSLLAAVLIAGLTVIGLTDARSDDATNSPSAVTNETSVRLTIELRDGSHVVGKSLDDPWRFHSASLGDMKLSVAGIRSIEFAANDETARLTVTNGDVFAVQFITPALSVETGFGKTELPVKLLKSVRMSASGNGQRPAGLVALWSGEDNANDSVGGNNGQLVGSVGFAPGKVGRAFDLQNGSGGDDFQRPRFGGFSGGSGLQVLRANRGGYVQIPTSPALDVGKGDGFTIEGWIKPVSVNQQMLIAEYERVLGTSDGADVGIDFAIQPSSALYANVLDSTPSHESHEISTPPNLLVAGVWQHVALTYDRASGRAALYVNGKVATQANLGSFIPQTSFAYLLLGGRTTFGSTANPRSVFSGGMDEIGFYDRALSDSEIQSVYETVSPNPPVATTQTPLPPKSGARVQTSAVAKDETGFRLTIELKDGSRVVGKSPDDTLRFHSSSLGNMKLSLGSIRAIEFAANSETARLTVTNGDVFAVQFSAATLRVETGFGKTELPVKLLKSVRVSPAGNGQKLSGLVAHWSGEGNANDSVGENNGQLVGSVRFAPGKVGQAFSLNEGGGAGDDFPGVRFGNGLQGFRPDRSGGFVQVPARPDLNVGLGDGLTVAAWINPANLNLQEVCEWNQNNGSPSGAAQIGVHLEINEAPGDGSLWGNVVDTSGVSHNLHSENGIIIPNSFQHVALTYDKVTGVAVLYRNGSVVATANLGVFTPQTSFDFFMGTRPSGVFTGIYFQGKLDEVGIYNRALSDSEVETLYGAVPPDGSDLPPQKSPPVPVVKPKVPSAVAATNETGFRLTIELKDGSRVTGKSPDDTLRFRSSSLGDMKPPLASIRAIEFAANGETARLTLTNGDAFAVQFSAATLPVVTAFGKTELPVKLIRSVKVSAMAPAGQLPSGLVSLWSGEGEGIDSVGGNNMMMTDISFAEGMVGQAFAFNGTSSTIKIPASTSLDVGAGDGFTIMAWIKPSDVDGVHPLIQWSEDNMLNLWIGIRPFENGVLRGDIGSDEGNHFVASHPGTLAAGVFQHVAFTYDKASGSGTLYLNGVIVAQRQLGGGLVAKTKGDLWFSQRNTRQGDWSSNQSFSGLMDEIAIYNRALSAEEIQAVFADQSHGEPLPLPASSTGWFESWMR